MSKGKFQDIINLTSGGKKFQNNMYKYESIYVKPNQTKKDQTFSYMCICTNTYKNTPKETKIKCQTVGKDPSGEANGIEDEKKVN